MTKTGLGHWPNMLQVTNELQLCGKPVGRLKLIIGIRVRTYVAHEAATGRVVNHIMWVMGLKILLLPTHLPLPLPPSLHRLLLSSQ